MVVEDVLLKLKKTSNKTEFRALLGGLTIGDAGGAMVLRKSNNEHGLWITCHSEGRHTELCYYNYTTSGNLEGQMLLKEISSQMIRRHKRLIANTYTTLGWTPKDIDKLFCHQVGARPHIASAKLAGQPLNTAPTTYEKLGNLTSATFPVNMYLNRPSNGEKLLLLGAGSGLSACQEGAVF